MLRRVAGGVPIRSWRRCRKVGVLIVKVSNSVLNRPSVGSRSRSRSRSRRGQRRGHGAGDEKGENKLELHCNIGRWVDKTFWKVERWKVGSEKLKAGKLNEELDDEEKKE